MDAALNGGNDAVGVSGPDEGLWIGIGFGKEAIDGGLEIDDRSEDAPLETPPGEPGERVSTAFSAKPLDPAIVEQVIALTPEDPPGEKTHWTADLMAKAIGISVSSVQRVWQAHGLQPHRVRRFKLSKDPEFVPPARDRRSLRQPTGSRMVLSVDEKSQIQALDRTQPGLPMKKGRAGWMHYDHAGAATRQAEQRSRRRRWPRLRGSSGSMLQ